MRREDVPEVSASVRIAMIAVVGTAAALSCVSESRRPTAQPSSSLQERGSGHWVYDQRLREIMQELQQETIVHWPQELDEEHLLRVSRGGQMAFDEAWPLAEALAKAADEIPKVVAHLDMTEADRRSFTAQAETLRDQARRLALASVSRDRNTMRGVLGMIDATCQSCHARFLDFSGPLPGR